MNHLILLIADGRFPGGGHAHSGGLEAAVADGSVHDLRSLTAFVAGRVTTAGPADSWAAARTSDGVDPLWVQGWYEAAVASPALRRAGRSVGRGLRRSAGALWPEVLACPAEQHPVVLGYVSRAVGIPPRDGAKLALQALVMGIATAAPKLFAIDMTDALRAVVSVEGICRTIVDETMAAELPPARSAPLTDARAEHHTTWEVRLFAS